MYANKKQKASKEWWGILGWKATLINKSNCITDILLNCIERAGGDTKAYIILGSGVLTAKYKAKDKRNSSTYTMYSGWYIHISWCHRLTILLYV